MKILLVGSEGNMGRRYQAIFSLLGIDHVCHDPLLGHDTIKIPTSADRVLIASSTATHYDWGQACAQAGIPFLCEKPISKVVEEVRRLSALCTAKSVDGRMVSNWRFHGPFLLHAGQCSVYYNYYNTGRDGFEWDLLQPIFLARDWKSSRFENTSPIFHAVINDVNVSLDDIGRSYVAMILNWLAKPETCWSIKEAVGAHEKVKRYIRWRQKHAHRNI